MTTSTTTPTTVPRHAVVSAWAVPILVVGQFALLAIVPVLLLVRTAVRRSTSRGLRWTTAALAAAYATPLVIWIVRDDPARSLSRDLHPALAGLIVVASVGVLLAIRHQRRHTTDSEGAGPGSGQRDGEATEIVMPGLVEPEGLVVRHAAIPVPGRGEAVVEMSATGVSFAEASMRRGRYPGQPAFPFIPGYDVVGVVIAVGPDVNPQLLGQRVAAVTKTGGWATHALVPASRAVAVPADVDDADAVALALNGITAWQMLRRKTAVSRGQTILVHGASGSVGHTLAQLALRDGIRVLGSASPRHHEALRRLGVEPLDYHDPALADQVRALAPGGVDAVFDNLGGDSFHRSFGLLAPGGRLVGYGTVSQQDTDGGMLVTFAKLLTRFALWNLTPNRRSATFYNFWGGQTLRPARFRRRLADDAAAVYDRLREGSLDARVAARIPLLDAGRALAAFESRTLDGKIVLVP